MNLPKHWIKKGLVAYDPDTETISFFKEEAHYPDRWRYWYGVHQTQEGDGTNFWIRHLREKGWFTAQMEYDMEEIWEELGII